MTTPPPTALVPDVLAGRPAAIARLLSLAESGSDEAIAALAEIHRHTGRAHIVGITGVPGSGKSTLIAQLCRRIRAGGRTVAVCAIDPTSPFSGGSILGDRVRMSDLNGDPGVFIRSMATRGALGGLSRATMPSVEIFDAAGFDVVIIETVGVGQDEVDIVRAAHTTVVVSAPGLGDDIQAIKAGVLEIADIHVVSKADRPDAQRTISELRGMLTIGFQPSGNMHWAVPVIGTSAVTGQGIDELDATIQRHMARMRETGELAARRRRMAEWRVLKCAEDILRDGFARDREGQVAQIADRVARLELAPEEGARQLLAAINSEP